MAATRAITIASNSTCTLLRKKPFVGGTALSLNNLKFGRTRRSYTCRAIYNPQVVVKEEGQPETLDYRVFFVDQSGKKVPFLLGQFWFLYFVIEWELISFVGFAFHLNNEMLGVKIFFLFLSLLLLMMVSGLYLIDGNVKLKCNNFQFLCVCLLFV